MKCCSKEFQIFLLYEHKKEEKEKKKLDSYIHH